ncbi:ead/Ea22-like family protein [Escherichia coli]|nr:ead/Ea22-like family protein [Escherichia coli]
MSEINYQELREAAAQAMHDDWGFDVDLFHEMVTPSIVLALLDERERNQQYIKRRDQENEDIALTVGKLRIELETAKSKLNEQREYYEGVISDGSKHIAELEKIATEYALKFQKAQDALKHVVLMRKSEQEATENNLIDSECHVAELEEALRDKQALLEASEKRTTTLADENEYIRKRFKELDLFFGKNILVMQAAIIEWRETGNAENALMWIYNILFGPGELPGEDEKNAQAYFDREYEPIDKELTELHRWFYESHKREKAKRTAKAENDQL